MNDMNEKVEKICFQIIKVGTILILFLPLLVYRQVLFPYVFSKMIVFQILVEIIFVAWLFLAIYGGKQYRPHWKTPLVFVLTIFMGILILTMFTGVDISKSFWSYQERMTGIVTLLHFYAFFIVLSSVFKKRHDWKKFIYASLMCSFLVGLYGLGQKLGFRFFLKVEGMQMTVTLGNPIFLAVYAMLNIFLASFILLQKNSKLVKIISVGLIIFNTWIMLSAASRGAMVAFGFSVVLFLMFLVFSKKVKFWLRALILSLLLLMIVSSIFFYSNKDKPWAKKAPIFQMLTTMGIKENKARLISWQIGLQGLKEKPLFGYGWENYNIIFNKHYSPYYLQKGAEATWFDRSHNQIVDLLALAGIFGVLVYLSIFGTLFYLLLQRLKKLENYRARISIVILALMFVAYFVQNLFVFDTPAPLIIFYFNLGLVYFITQRSDLPLEVGPQRGGRFPLPVLIFLVIIFLPLALYKFNIEPFQQSRLAIRGVHASKVDLKSGLHWYEKALEKQTFANLEIRTQLAKTVSEQYAQKNPDTQTVVRMTEFAIAEYKKSVDEHPLDARHWLYLGQLYNLGMRYNKSYVDEAEKVLQKALELSPKRQQIYFELARIEIIRENLDKAIELLEEAVELDPEVKDSQFNLAAAYLSDGRYREGVEAADKAWQLSHRWYGNDKFMESLAEAYNQVGDYNKAIREYSRAVRVRSRDASLKFKLAQMYAKTGDAEDKQRARNSAKKALELDLSLKSQIDEFLKQLEQ